MISKIIDEINNINYGYLDINNNIHNDVDDSFKELYRLQDPKKVLQNKIGVCWDQVELERELFSRSNIKFKTYFIVYYDNDECPTHTFLIYENNGHYLWFEHSWEKYSGIHMYNSEEEALKDIRSKFISSELENDYNHMNLCIYEYSTPKYGLDVSEFYKHCESGKKIII